MRAWLETLWETVLLSIYFGMALAFVLGIGGLFWLLIEGIKWSTH